MVFLWKQSGLRKRLSFVQTIYGKIKDIYWELLRFINKELDVRINYINGIEITP